MASEGLFSGCWTPAALQTFQVPPEGTQLKVRPFGTRVGTLADLKISKACWNIYRRISSGGVIAWHGRHELRDTTGLPFASLTRIDKNVRAPMPLRTCSLASRRLCYRAASLDSPPGGFDDRLPGMSSCPEPRQATPVGRKKDEG